MHATARQIAAIHAGAKQAGLEEEDRRALMQRETGKTSAKLLTQAEAFRVLDEIKRLGGSARPAGKTMAGPYAGVLRALWLTGYNFGIIENRDDQALIAFVERQTGLSHPRFLTEHHEATRAIEALKSWISRETGLEWPTARELEHMAYADGVPVEVERKIHVVRRQFEVARRLAGATHAAEERDLLDHLNWLTWQHPDCTPKALDEAAARLGRKIRKWRDGQAGRKIAS